MIDTKGTRGIYAFFKFLAVMILFIFIVFLIVYKANNPDFKLGSLLALIGLLIIVIILIIFSTKILQFFNKKRKNGNKKFELPAPITIEECEKMVIENLGGINFADRIGKVLEAGPRMVGKEIKSSVYVHSCQGKREPNINYVHLINQHFPETKYTVLINPSKKAISEALNSLAIDPVEIPDSEEIEEYRDPISGEVRRTTRRATYQKNEEKEVAQAEQ